MFGRRSTWLHPFVDVSVCVRVVHLCVCVREGARWSLPVEVGTWDGDT